MAATKINRTKKCIEARFLIDVTGEDSLTVRRFNMLVKELHQAIPDAVGRAELKPKSIEGEVIGYYGPWKEGVITWSPPRRMRFKTAK